MFERNPRWGEQLKQVHEQLPVNEPLKAELRRKLEQEGKELQRNIGSRKSFQRSKARRYWIWGVAAALVTGVVLGWSMLFEPKVPRVLAADLQLEPQFNSSKNLGKDLSISTAIHGDITYQAIPGYGVYRQQNLSYERIIPGNATILSISPSGKQLAYVMNEDIIVMDVATKQTRSPVEFSSKSVQITGLAWSEDESRLVYVTEEANANAIWEIDLSSNEKHYVTKGTSPSYIRNKDQLMFENEGRIYTRNLDSGKEELWAQGRSPVVSPDGKYVMYIRTGEPMNMEDVWLADLDRSSKQQITRNELIDGWEKGKPKDGTKQPYFQLAGLTWNTSSNEVAMYQVVTTNVTRYELVRYSLSSKKLKPEEVVGKAIEGLIYRDERYAQSFFSYDPGYLKGTSPSQVNYQILKISLDSNGTATVVSTIEYSYQEPYYRVDTVQFTLTKGERGYLIGNMKELDTVCVSEWGEEVVTTTPDDQRGEFIFKLDQLPIDDGWTNGKFGSLVYRESEDGRQIWFTIMQKHKQGDGEQSRLRLMRYDWDEKSFHKLGVLKNMDRSSLMIIDPSRAWAAVQTSQLTSTQSYRYDIAILGLHREDAAPIYLSSKLNSSNPNYMNMNTRMWKGSKLSFFVEWEEQDIFMTYDVHK